MDTVATLGVVVDAETKNAIGNLTKFQTQLQNMSKGLQDMGTKMSMFVTVPLLGAGLGAFKMASDVNESLNKVNVAFGDSADAVVNWSEEMLTSHGIAKGTALDMSALFGDMATGMGIMPDKASDMSMSLSELAGDMASFKNISVDRAQTALAGVFTGETEALKGLGIVMTQANLEAYALANGITKSKEDMTQAELVALRYGFIMDATKNSQGDFARTADGSANQMRIMTESIKEVSASFGEILIPIITPVIAKINEFLLNIKNLSAEKKELIMRILGIVAVVGPLLLIVGKMISIFTAVFGVIKQVQTAGTALNFLFTTMTGPIGWIILAVGALIAIGVALYMNWDAISAWGKETWSNIVGWFNESVAKISEALNSLKTWAKNAFLGMWEAVKGVFNSFIKGGLLGVINDYIIKPIFGIDLVKAGKNMIEGLWNGIKSMGTWLSDKAESFFGGFVKGVKDFFGIKSPSKLFFGFGEYVAEGLSNGIESSVDMVQNASKTLGVASVEGFNMPSRDNESIEVVNQIMDSNGKPVYVTVQVGPEYYSAVAEGINRESRMVGKSLIETI